MLTDSDVVFFVKQGQDIDDKDSEELLIADLLREKPHPCTVPGLMNKVDDIDSMCIINHKRYLSRRSRLIDAVK